MTIQKLPLSALHQPEKNVRRHTDKQIGEYIRSLRMFGQVKPIIIDEAGEIICGNGLFLALTQMGAECCDCYVMEGLTAAQKKKLMLADNRVYELGITDIDVFEDLIRELDGDIDVPGWDDDLLRALSSTAQEVDNMVSGYGAFDADDTQRIKERDVSTTIPMPARDIAPYGQLQQGVNEIQAPIDRTYRPEEHPQETVAKARSGQYVICPHCGSEVEIPTWLSLSDQRTAQTTDEASSPSGARQA